MVFEKGFSEEEKKRKERCILVGFRIDGDGRKLLSWALTSIAKEGDFVMAVNVSRNDTEVSKTPTLTLFRILNEFMTEHEDLCNKKKVILAGRIARGNSIKRILVKEAELCAAKAVVLGANKNFSFGCSTSLAQYCAKKLPSTVSVIAVHKEQVVFERAATKLKPISGGEEKRNLRSFLHPNLGMDAKPMAPTSARISCDQKKKTVNKTTKETKDYCLISYDKMRKTNRNSVSATSRQLPEPKDYCLISYEKLSNRNSVSVLQRKLPERKPGWPLLCKSMAAKTETLQGSEGRKMSVVQWVMNLPDRSMPFTKSEINLIKELERILKLNSSACKFFKYEELQNSTNFFSQENLIGKGGNSQVYIGCLPNGHQVAIKVSKFSEKSSRDFLLEVDIITRLQHKRIMSLVGICVEDKNPISIYSLCSRGSLEDNLHGKRSKASLDWEMRFQVAVGVAEALDYLHNGCSRPVIHRDVKSSNILLSDKCKPKLSDFGLAIWGPTTSPCLTHGDVVGTFGYIAPEYFMYGKVSIKVDVYAFGVVLLELLTGRKPINDESPKGLESLVMWAIPILERGDVVELLDPILDGKYEEDQMKRMVCAASLCIRRAARRRPQMNQVLEILRGEQEIEPWMSSNVNNNLNEQDGQEEEAYPSLSIGPHIDLALLDVDDDASIISFEQNHLNSLDKYLQDRWSGSSSFD
ncbi:proline-rich receptor-like protein kinase PERK3 [Phalaenopsis equestris]|uniref:proline-rich receptor-like protein kinase PERK3 n=1 Tax=Phalaenopsis equestris TaxID=78828 RepID=UPI0009E63DCF|nr:proline-rich receptor-like protein kinase PERK3 [Phalaenopsis equestris]XP_020581757.1 proline-rich receptor-like protein kinase PERK3 [Phalaenopsis equestris]